MAQHYSDQASWLQSDLGSLIFSILIRHHFDVWALALRRKYFAQVALAVFCTAGSGSILTNALQCFEWARQYFYTLEASLTQLAYVSLVGSG